MDAKEVLLEQGTSEWLKWRNGGIGSSDAPKLLGHFGGLKKMKKEPRSNWAMQRGTALEPHARIAFIEKTGIWLRPSCWQHQTRPYLRASLDGLSDDNKLLVEIKCPSMKSHLEAMEGNIADHYRIQVNHQMLVLGLNSALYWSYNPDHPDPECHFAAVRVDRDEEICRQILDRAEEWVEQQKNAAR
jgi:putative phage-type endonuclease